MSLIIAKKIKTHRQRNFKTRHTTSQKNCVEERDWKNKKSSKQIIKAKENCATEVWNVEKKNLNGQKQWLKNPSAPR